MRFELVVTARTSTESRCRRRASTTSLNALAAIGAARAAGCRPERRRGRSRASGPRAPLRGEGEARRRARVTTTTPTTRPRSRRRCGGAGARPRRLVAVFQPHLYSRTRTPTATWAARSPPPTWWWCSTCTRPASAPEDYPASAASSSPLRPPTARAGARSGGCRPREATRVLPRLREGDLVVTLGAGDVDQVAAAAGRRLEARMSTPPEHVRADYPLARLTTSAPGAAPLVRAPAQRRGARGLLRVGRGRWLDVGVVGSGSNLLVADAGFAGLVLKLDGPLP